MFGYFIAKYKEINGGSRLFTVLRISMKLVQTNRSVCMNLLNPGDNKPHFIPGMMGPFLGVTLVPQTEVRNIMIPIFHDMMDWEQRKNGNFKQVA